MREEEKDQLLLKIAEEYKERVEERDEAMKGMQDFARQHAELLGLLIGLVNQFVKEELYDTDELLLKKVYMPSLAVSEYRIKWVDVPEEEAIRLEVKHYTDN